MLAGLECTRPTWNEPADRRPSATAGAYCVVVPVTPHVSGST